MTKISGFFDNFQMEDSLPPLEDLQLNEETPLPEVEPEEEAELPPVDESEPEETPEEEPETPEAEEDFTFAPFVESLETDDILYVDPNKEYEDTPEGFAEIISDTVTKRFQEKLESFDPKIQRIISLAEQGADLEQILAEERQTDYTRVDLEDEENQMLLIEEHLLATGWEEEDIKEEMERIQDAGETERKAKVAQKYLVKQQEQSRKEFEVQVEQSRKQRETQEAHQLEDFRKKVTTTRDLGGLKVTKQEAEKLFDFITRPVSKDGKTQLQLESSEESQLKMAYLMMKKFDFSDIRREEQTNATRTLKKNLKRFSDNNAKPKGGTPIQESKPSLKINSPFFSHPGDIED